MCLSKTQLPGKSCIVNGTFRSSTGSSVITGDQDNLSTSFCNTCSYRTNSSLRYQFYRNPCIFIRIFQVIDQLCQILNGVNIVMRRRGNQAHTRCRVSCLCDPRVYFSCRQMAAFTRFCSLCHLNLDFLCTNQIAAGNTKSTGCYLLDCRASILSTSCRIQTFITLTTLTGIRFTMQVIHGDSQCLMGFL